MTEPSPQISFLTALRKIDGLKLRARDFIILWAIDRHPGMMGREVAMKLGYPSRSMIQDGMERLIARGFVQDRRVRQSKETPNDLHSTPAGKEFLADVFPA